MRTSLLAALASFAFVSSAFAIDCVSTVKDEDGATTMRSYRDVRFEREARIDDTYAFAVYTVRTGPETTHEFIQVEDRQGSLSCDQNPIFEKLPRTQERRYAGVETACERVSVRCTF